MHLIFVKKPALGQGGEEGEEGEDGEAAIGEEGRNRVSFSGSTDRFKTESEKPGFWEVARSPLIYMATLSPTIA